MEIKVKDRQSLLDIAVQTAGGMDAAFELSQANDVAITEILQDGQVLDSVAVVNAETVRRYKAQKIEPATALSEEELSTLMFGGIDFMGIEVEFIVS